MNQTEKNLFKELCSFRSNYFDEELLAYASPHVLGQLFFNRMQGVAFGCLKKHELLGKVNREFRNSLKAAYEQNVRKNHDFYQCVTMVSNLLSDLPFKVAMLKGAFLCSHYPDGYRTSNDIDILVLPENVTDIGNILSAAGFKQGNLRNDEFIPATRREIIESKMMRGETVPYIKKVDLPTMKYLEVDVNFSLDYKNGETDILRSILERAMIIEENGILIPTLCKEDFFIHLCAHLYKEATTYPWIRMRRDMSLYKYMDIYLLLHEYTADQIQNIFTRASELGVDKVCAYTILEVDDLFDSGNLAATSAAKTILEKDPEFRLRVYDPERKTSLVYQVHSASDRFFAADRTTLLKEVVYDEEA